MSIQTEQFLNEDGRTMTPEQLEISRLKKSDAKQNEELTALKRRVADLEVKQQDAERKAKRGPNFGPG